MRGDEIKREAPAKANLFLEVMGKRVDGYHNIRSVIVPISLCDTLTFEKTDHEVLTTVEAVGISGDNGSFVCESEDNLTTRAARALKRATGYEGGSLIHIEKNIPVGGGLGGGSADAAATLKGLNDLWGTGLLIEELCEIGRPLGADIPALVYGQPVLAEGVGTTITRIQANIGASDGGWWLVLVNPGFHVSTAGVYEKFTRSLTSPPGAIKSTVSALENGDIEKAAISLFNNLEPVVFDKYPSLSLIVEKLREAGALGALLCGSGASMFGLAHSEAHAHEVCERVGRLVGAATWRKVVRVLPDGVMVAHGPLEARV
jgi:4-diphosphocytidyl-2-C-methyl-D-erythritol kinase